VRSGKSSKIDENDYKSSLGGHRQKLIGALNSAGIGKDAKSKNTSKFFHTKLVRSGNSSKNDYKLGLGNCRQKPIGVLNSARIGKHAEPKQFHVFILKNW
jgi:hypothetical protein